MEIDRSSEAYAYGQLLGAYRRALIQFAQTVAAGMNEFGRQTFPERTAEEMLEITRQREYRQMIAMERQKGLRFVINEANRVRRDLGLPLTTSRPKRSY